MLLPFLVVVVLYIRASSSKHKIFGFKAKATFKKHILVKYLSYLTPTAWNNLPQSMKLSSNINSFKHRVKFSSRPEVFCKKGALRNIAKFTEKPLCQSLFLNKVAGAGCNFIKKETLAQLFSCKFCEISKNTFSYRTPPVAASEAKNKIFPVID